MIYRNRYYSTELGRFVSRDPMLYEAGDQNVYRYVGNGPHIFVDSLGLLANDPLSFDGAVMALARAGWSAREIAAATGISLEVAAAAVAAAAVEKAVE